jgi:hypothetical protein
LNTVVQSWLAALRSGAYQQTRGMMRNEKGFCCLGVLCDVVDNSKWVPQNKEHRGYYFYTYNPGDKYGIGVPPKEIRDQTGFSLPFFYELMKLNDSGVPFPDIANRIEAEAKPHE